MERSIPAHKPIRPTFAVHSNLFLFWLVSGCASIPADPSLPALTETYTGALSLPNGPASATMVLTRVDSVLHVVVSLPEREVVARGEGLATEAGFNANVAYVAECPGTAAFTVRREEGGRLLVGTLLGSECGESYEGSFRFVRDE
jgi:hypothetical protein